MSQLNLLNTKQRIQQFQFHDLLIEELGWSNPPSFNVVTEAEAVAECQWTRRPIAELGGVWVFEIISATKRLPNATERLAIHQHVRQYHHEHLLIFLDKSPQPTQSLWSWVKPGEAQARELYYCQGQTGELLISQLPAMLIDFNEFDEAGNVSVLKVVEKLQKALDVERVTKQFYQDFETQHLTFTDLIGGIEEDRDRRWYASVLLNRLMFIWFLQKTGFLDNGNHDYLVKKLAESQQRGENRFYAEFLQALFFDGFAKPQPERAAQVVRLIGEIRYLNGGLFLHHPIEQRWPSITVPDRAFANLFVLFAKYTWSLNDTPGGADNEVNPNVLGYIFEKYINQKQFGAYYTRPEITEYLCEQTIYPLILEQVNAFFTYGVFSKGGKGPFDSVPDLLIHLDANSCRHLWLQVLPRLTLLDPACGSGAFLVAAMKMLIQVYTAVLGRIPFLADAELKQRLREVEKDHPNVLYYIKKQIISQNLFGVDVMEEATEIAKLRLFLALVSSAERVDQLEPLPNIDFNLLAGNSLVGLLKVDGEKFMEVGKTGYLFKAGEAKTYQQVLAEKNRLIGLYRDASGYAADQLQGLRDEIYHQKQAAQVQLNQLLLKEFERLKIQFEEVTWDETKQKEGKAKKRPLTVADLVTLHPFHWGYEFDEVLKRGGFDAIITNPPWEVFKPQAKEFFADYSEVVTKNKMTIKEFEKAQAQLLKTAEVKHAWLAYQSRFPYVSQYFRSSPQYPHQSAVVNGKKTGTDINLYKLFVEQCHNLLRDGGQCGIVIPSGIYTDLGATGLRDLLFDHAEVTTLFGFENRKAIFEGVDSRFKFVVLTFLKGRQTSQFPAAFMRHEVQELARFPKIGGLWLSTDLIRKLSPNSHSVMEFKNEKDIAIAQKMLTFSLLGEKLEGTWNLVLANEFHMTNDSHLFQTSPGKGRLPLYEGKMIHQFDHRWGEPKYWIDETEGRKALLGKKEENKGQWLEYQGYRLGFRDVAGNTNERTMIATVLPKNIYLNNKLPYVVTPFDQKPNDLLSSVCLSAIWNNFVFDYLVRQRVTTNLTFFHIYQLPVPRLTLKDPRFFPIVTRAARLICTTPEYEELAKEVADLSGLRDLTGLTDSVQRAQVRAELDGMIAHLYGLTKEEFCYILTTFPLVKEEVKERAMGEYLKKLRF